MTNLFVKLFMSLTGASASSCMRLLQVVYGVFLLFCPIGEAVSQTVQTYLPGYTVKRPPNKDGTPRKTLTFGKVRCGPLLPPRFPAL